jgi:ABC-type amino acid transport substrate-binding protein
MTTLISKFRLTRLAAGIAIVGLAATSLVACSTATPEAKPSARDTYKCQENEGIKRVLDSGVLRVAATKSPPLSWEELKDNSWRGYDADILKEIAKRMGVTAEATFPTAAGQIAAIESNRADTTTGLLTTPERQEVVGFTDSIRWLQVNIITRSDDSRIKSIDDLSDKTIGVSIGNAGARAAEAMRAKGVIGEIVTTQQPDEAYNLLKTKRVDAIIFPFSNFEWSLQGENRDKAYEFKSVLTLDQSWYGVSSGEGSAYAVVKSVCGEELAAAMLGKVKEMRDDGTMEKIFTSYGISQKMWLPSEDAS